MAKALEYPVVFKALLEDGHICAIAFSNNSRTEYTVHVSNVSIKLGHITEKQFQSLVQNGLIVPGINPSNKDKYGNLYTYYRLPYKITGVELGE